MSLFPSCFSVIRQCSISSSCDTDSALSVSQYQMRCPEWWLLQVYSRAPSSSVEAGPRICLRNSREIIFQLIILLHVYYARHFLRWHLPYFPLWDSRAPHEWCHVTYPLSDHGLITHFARIVNRSIGCSHPGTWRTLVGDQSSSFLTVYSTTGSPKVSLGSEIVTRFVSTGSRVSVV